jgi:transposase
MDGRELKQYESWKDEVQRLRGENQYLRREVDTFRPAWYRASVRIDKLEQRVERLDAENKLLKQRVKELTLAGRQAATGDAASPPPFVKPPATKRRRKRPGRKPGHPAALRPMPEKIDAHQEVPLPRDSDGRASCPHCNACLADLENHERIVEDIIPAKVVVTCYHTTSGWCPCCRKRIESRALEQPPAANIPHGQLGLNALATGVLLRVTHRLPFRQVSKIFADLPEITVSPGAITRQVQRISNWLEDDYQQLLVSVRSAPQVHADETGWRTDGKNGWLWALTTPTQTVYHIDKSRGGKVIRKLLGKAFGGTLVSDFYSAYSKMNCKKQKCLVHLLREFVQTGEKSPEFAKSNFCRKSKRLIKEMLLLKGRWGQIDDKIYASRVQRLVTRLDQLADADYGEADAKRIGKRLRKFKTELTAFLLEKELDGTNNAAERAIRPVVVARKISGGSRSDNGAKAFATLASLLRTAGQQGQKVLGTIKSLLIAAWSVGNPAVVAKERSGGAR